MDKATYKEILESLRRDILGGKYGHALPSVGALVRKYGVARATVHHSLEELFHQGLISRKQGSGTFVRKKAAFRNIGLIVPGVAYNEIYPPIVGEILRQAQMSDYKLFISDMPCADSKGVVRQVERTVAEYARDRVAGVIFQPFEYAGGRDSYTDRALSLLKGINVPVVLLGYDIVAFPARSDYDVVGINNFAAGARAAEHLCAQGARRVFFFDGPDCSFSARERIRGIADVLGPKRFTAEKNIFRARSDSVAAVRSCMKRHRPDAVICRNDAAAAMLKQALEACGISVPRDVMLVGFDDVNIARLTQITSIRQPCDSIARAAFRRLVDRIEDPSMEPAEIYLNAPLVRRGSTDRKNRGKPTTTEEMHP